MSWKSILPIALILLASSMMARFWSDEHERENSLADAGVNVTLPISPDLERSAVDLWRIDNWPTRLRPNGGVEIVWDGRPILIKLSDAHLAEIAPILKGAEESLTDNEELFEGSAYFSYMKQGTHYACTSPTLDLKPVQALCGVMEGLHPNRDGRGPHDVWLRGVVSPLNGGWQLALPEGRVEFKSEIGESLNGQQVVLFGELSPGEVVEGLEFYNVHNIIELGKPFSRIRGRRRQR